MRRGEFSVTNSVGNNCCSDQSALTCLKALCKIASRDSNDISAATIAEENMNTTAYFSAANALDADEYILASRFLAIDLPTAVRRTKCEGVVGRV